jgi:hypothetical protein
VNGTGSSRVWTSVEANGGGFVSSSSLIVILLVRAKRRPSSSGIPICSRLTRVSPFRKADSIPVRSPVDFGSASNEKPRRRVRSVLQRARARDVCRSADPSAHHMNATSAMPQASMQSSPTAVQQRLSWVNTELRLTWLRPGRYKQGISLRKTRSISQPALHCAASADLRMLPM